MKLAHVSRDEIAVIIMAEWMGVRRPPGIPAEFLLAEMEEDARQRMVAISDAVVTYIAGCMERAEDIPAAVN